MLPAQRAVLSAMAQDEQARALDQAMDWMVRLNSGRAQARDHAAFARWRESSPAHDAAWTRLQERLGQSLRAIEQLDSRLPGQDARIGNLLRQPMRRSALKALLAAVGVGTGAWLADRVVPLGTLTADLQTRTGQRRAFALADGSQLALNARSAVDVDVAAATRQAVLREGDVVARVSPAAERPFLLMARHVSVVARQGRFLVSQGEARTRVFALAETLQLRAAAGGERELLPGRGVTVDALGRWQPVTGSATGAEWEQGYLSASPLPLGEVVAALRRYTPAVLRVAPEAAALPVQASLPLDDVDRALRALVDTQPITVRRYSPWWITLDTQRGA
ncbi:Fe2+-dicitrate sensor, membrane component [plant metagenome]|uniref:Fe2+-dicitrate sensor, membrane component n=1 Tax=plant metagenome TaxID=1297885 RepID=A0A484U3A1_9ZZZZ